MFKRLYKLIQQKTISYDVGVSDLDQHSEPIYENQPEWESVNSLKLIGDGELNIEGHDHDHITQSPTNELLIRFGHMSRIQSLAAEGVLPRHSEKCPILTYASCMYGKMTKKPWWY
jgi:hypothetical protein